MAWSFGRAYHKAAPTQAPHIAEYRIEPLVASRTWSPPTRSSGNVNQESHSDISARRKQT
jgi:hypothetical protein